MKHAFLSEDRRLWDYLITKREDIQKRDKGTLSELVAISLEVKRSYLEKDPEETKGIRSFLNFGHTFAHALESIQNFTLSHGEAVAWGLGRALEAGYIAGITPRELFEEGLELLRLYGYDTNLRIGRGEWIAFSNAMKKDKKKSNGAVKFVLLAEYGHPMLSPLEDSIVRNAVIQSVRYRV